MLHLNFSKRYMRIKSVMRRKKERDEGELRLNPLRHLSPETKKSIGGVILLGIAALLILAEFERAGPAGEIIYTVLSKFLGIGYLFLPVILIVVSGVFLLQKERRGWSLTILGAVFFILSALGIIEIVIPGKGGYVGS